jgi:hypothetical protein
METAYVLLRILKSLLFSNTRTHSSDNNYQMNTFQNQTFFRKQTKYTF